MANRLLLIGNDKFTVKVPGPLIHESRTRRKAARITNLQINYRQLGPRKNQREHFQGSTLTLDDLQCRRAQGQDDFIDFRPLDSRALSLQLRFVGGGFSWSLPQKNYFQWIFLFYMHSKWSAKYGNVKHKRKYKWSSFYFICSFNSQVCPLTNVLCSLIANLRRLH